MSDNREKTADSVSGGIFLIGLGILFLTGIGFWPNILLVIAATAFADNFLKGLWADAVISVIVLGGLALWLGGAVTGDLLLPIALIGIGLVMLLNVVRRTDYGSPKRKHGDFYDDEAEVIHYE